MKAMRLVALALAVVAGLTARVANATAYVVPDLRYIQATVVQPWTHAPSSGVPLTITGVGGQDSLDINGTAPTAAASGAGTAAGVELSVLGATGGATADQGGATAGRGANITLTTGTGGAATGAAGAQTSGAGGTLTLSSGGGGLTTSATGTGGAGGPINITAGAGTAGGVATGGAGGTIQIFAGAGGNGTTTGGIGGNVVLRGAAAGTGGSPANGAVIARAPAASYGTTFAVQNSASTSNFTVTDAGAFTASAASAITVTSGTPLAVTGPNNSLMASFSDGTRTISLSQASSLNLILFAGSGVSLFRNSAASGLFRFQSGAFPTSFDIDPSAAGTVTITSTATSTGFTLNASNAPGTTFNFQSNGTSVLSSTAAGLTTALGTGGVALSVQRTNAGTAFQIGDNTTLTNFIVTAAGAFTASANSTITGTNVTQILRLFNVGQGKSLDFGNNAGNEMTIRSIGDALFFTSGGIAGANTAYSFTELNAAMTLLQATDSASNVMLQVPGAAPASVAGAGTAAIAASLTGGTGGATSGTTGQTAGVGGANTIAGGAGGAATGATGANVAGAGGAFAGNGGAGGAVTSATGTGGAGGASNLTAGAGSGTGATGGAGGGVAITAGAGGNGTTTGGAGGGVTIVAGAVGTGGSPAAGTVIVRTNTNSVQGVRFHNASSTIIASIDTTNSRMRIGDATAPTATFDLAGTLTAAGASGLITRYNNVATAALGLAPIVASSNLTGQTSGQSGATFTAAGSFRVNSYVNVTAWTTPASFAIQVTYTDDGGTARTVVIPVLGTGGAYSTTSAPINAVGIWQGSTFAFNTNNAAITVQTAGTFTGSPTYNFYSSIEQLR